MPNFHAHAAKMRDAGKRGRCLHPSAGGGNCGTASIASHTVQRNGGLSAIAEDGHILTTFVDFAHIARANGKPEPKRMGLKEASTFPGFCAKHDGALFAPIEEASLTIDQKSAFLFHYRAICLEFVRKSAAMDGLPAARDLDAGRPVRDQLSIQTFLSAWGVGLARGMEDLVVVKSRLDAKLLAEDWGDTSYCFVQFDALLPAVAAFAMHPESDWTAKKIQDLSDFERAPDELSITLTSYQGRSCAVFAWVGAPEGPRRTFVESFLAIEDADKAARLISGCFELAENTHMRPSWWNSFDANTRAAFSDKIWHGTPHRPRPDNGLQDRVPLLEDVGIMSVAASWDLVKAT